MSAKKTETKGNKSFITIITIVLVAGLAILGYQLTRPKPAAVVIDPNAPPPRPQGYVMGSDTAPVEIVMFGDFECPGCGRFVAITEPDVRNKLVLTGAARYRFVDFPLVSIHPSTADAHNAGACANAQGKFWEMHDAIYAGQHEWSQFANGKNMNAPKVMKRYAKDIGLNTGTFNACFEAQQFWPQIVANAKEGERLGVGGTPTFLIGSRLLQAGGQAYDHLKLMVDSATMDAKKNPAARKAFGDTAVTKAADTSKAR